MHEDRTGTTVKGYEPALIKTKGKLVLGRVIDPERMRQGTHLDHLVFQTSLPITPSQVDLRDMFDSEDGKVWINSFIEYFKQIYNEDAPLNLLIEDDPFPQKVLYTMYPKDINKIGEVNSCPKGILNSVPKSVAYYTILPPLRFNDGQNIPNVYYNRSLVSSNGNFNSYSIRDPQDEKHFNMLGVILGPLVKKDFFEMGEGAEGAFPVNNYLKVSYPIALREIGRRNPLSISFELEPDTEVDEN